MTKEEILQDLSQYKLLKDIGLELSDFSEQDLVDIYMYAVQHTKNNEEYYFKFAGRYEYNNNFEELIDIIPVEILKKYPQICIEGVRISKYNLKYVPLEVQEECPEIILEAIHNGGDNEFSYIEVDSKILDKNNYICKELIKSGLVSPYSKDESLKKAENDVVRELIEEHPYNYGEQISKIKYDIKNISSDLLETHPDLYGYYIKGGGSLSEIPEDVLQEHPEIYMSVFEAKYSVNGLDSYKIRSEIKRFPESILKENQEIVEKIFKVEGCGSYIKYMPKEYLEEKPEICLIAIKNGASISDLPEKVVTKEFLKKCFQIREDISCDWEFLNEIAKNKDEKIGAEWQQECLEQIKDCNMVILSAPTGSGKTNVFLEWAKQKKQKPVFITSPIKALSNQRWRELKKQGFVVGLETGDIKDVPENCDFICCTQEIYTNKYVEQEDATLIIDEFSYIFENKERVRTYIDALHNSKAKNILLCSATMGNIEKLKKYVNKVSKKEFVAYEGKSRLTSLKYRGDISKEEIKDALVIAFSKENIKSIVNTLCEQREKIEDDKIQKLNVLAYKYNIGKTNKYNIGNNISFDALERGVVGYYGKMLPREKLFIEECYEKRILDTVVGTDALAMGVNFPVKNEVYAQLAKMYDGPISKNMFDQISGRAGRKGYFDEGNVYFCTDFYNDRGYPIETRGYNTASLYGKLMFAENEDISIQLTPNIKNILMGNVSIGEEAEYITEFSTGKTNLDTNFKRISNIIEYIKDKAFEKEVNRIVNEYFGINEDDEYDHYYDYEEDEEEEEYYKESDEEKEMREKLMLKQDEFLQNIARVYFDEYSPEKNCEIFADILCGIEIDKILEKHAISGSFNDMLQFRKYVKALPKEYRQGLTKINEIIREIDDTAIDGYRGEISDIEIGEVLNRENRLGRKSVLAILKEQEQLQKMSERVDILEEQLRIAEQYGLEEYR